MSRPSYIGALTTVLEPLGFIRKGNEFLRRVGDFEDCIVLQVSQVAGITVNVFARDLVTEAILDKAVPNRKGLMYPFGGRIGEFIDGNDRWWIRDPAGAKQMAEEVRIYALPFLDQIRPLEAQARYLGHGARPRGGDIFWAAVTFYRLGLMDEACAALASPSTTQRKVWMPQIQALREWLGCRPADPQEIRS